MDNNFVRFSLVSMLFASALSLACKDDSPCDSGEVSIGTGCFAAPTGGSGGGSVAEPVGGSTEGGEPSVPVGNPDATFGTPCATDADCGGDAPLCDNKVFNYCLQTDCAEGEPNEGVCPAGWVCVPKGEDPQTGPHPSACIDPAAL
jgi:hypothetical protein